MLLLGPRFAGTRDPKFPTCERSLESVGSSLLIAPVLNRLDYLKRFEIVVLRDVLFVMIFCSPQPPLESSTAFPTDLLRGAFWLARSPPRLL